MIVTLKVVFSGAYQQNKGVEKHLESNPKSCASANAATSA
jgi:hypothetical protein